MQGGYRLVIFREKIKFCFYETLREVQLQYFDIAPPQSAPIVQIIISILPKIDLGTYIYATIDNERKIHILVWRVSCTLH